MAACVSGKWLDQSLGCGDFHIEAPLLFPAMTSSSVRVSLHIKAAEDGDHRVPTSSSPGLRPIGQLSTLTNRHLDKADMASFPLRRIGVCSSIYEYLILGPADHLHPYRHLSFGLSLFHCV